MTLHIFNPSHDEALAINSASYLGSKASQTLERDLASLPLLWAKKGDTYWQKSASIDWNKVECIDPWGWNKALVHQLQKAGAPTYLLPTEAQIEGIRRLSHRQTALQLLDALKAKRKDAYTDCESVFCNGIEAIEYAREEMHKRGKNVLFKAPWSCSGRGVFREQDPHAKARVARILREQGGIMMEAEWQKEKDFAMLFDYDKCQLHFCGISLFDTNEKGAYKGNIIDTQDALMARLVGKHSALADTFGKVRQDIESLLPPLLGDAYEGPLGIDMMSRRQAIHPCVEINLRRTMGRVAFDISHKANLHTSLPALFTLQYKDKHMTYTINSLQNSEKS